MTPVGNFRSNSVPAAPCYPNGLLHEAIRGIRRMVRAASGRAEPAAGDEEFRQASAYRHGGGHERPRISVPSQCWVVYLQPADH
jgi:hypothetical protein